MDLFTAQQQIGQWSKKNFPKSDARDRVLGVVEEIGELTEAEIRLLKLYMAGSRLSHLCLKEQQGIRYTDDQLREMLFDSVGDIMIYLLDFCAFKQINAEQALKITMAKVLKRDWNENPITAGDDDRQLKFAGFDEDRSVRKSNIQEGEKIPTAKLIKFIVCYNFDLPAKEFKDLASALSVPTADGLKIFGVDTVGRKYLIYEADGEAWHLQEGRQVIE